MALGSEELKSAFEGIVGFGVTPFRDDLSVDLEALRQNAAFLAEHCEVVVPLAGNGEIYALSPEEHKTIGRAVVEEVRGRKPVLVGVGFTMPIARDLAQAAEAYGADGVLVLPPYFTHANDDGLFEYYRSIAAATKLGVILFQTHATNFQSFAAAPPGRSSEHCGDERRARRYGPVRPPMGRRGRPHGAAVRRGRDSRSQLFRAGSQSLYQRHG